MQLKSMRFAYSVNRFDSKVNGGNFEWSIPIQFSSGGSFSETILENRWSLVELPVDPDDSSEASSSSSLLIWKVVLVEGEDVH